MLYGQIIVIALAIVFSACTRKTEDDSKKTAVNFAFPHSIGPMSNKLSSLSAGSSELVHVSISITGPGIPGTILYEWDSCKDCISAPPPPGSFEMMVPSGESRFFQVMTVYEGDAGMIFKYGDTVKTLATAEESVGIPMTDLSAGQVGTGRVSGRYLTATNAGPSGRVEVRYRPPGKPPMVVFEEQIVNGWFSFFMLSGLDFEYYVKSTGQTLWGGPVNLNSPLVSPTTTANSLSRMKMYMPIHKRVGSFTPLTFEDDESKLLIWGYYADLAAASLVSAKKVCLEHNAVTRIYTYETTPDLLTPEFRHSPTDFTNLPTYALLNDEVSPYPNYFVLGGLQFDTSPQECAGMTESGNVFTNFLRVSAQNFDGNGNDSVPGFRGIFAAIPGNPSPVNVTGSSSKIINGNVLPGMTPLFSKIKAYKRLAIDHSKEIETPDCNRLMSQGFVFGGEVTISGTGFSIDPGITGAQAAAGIEAVLCPATAADVLSPFGAIFIHRESFGYESPPHHLKLTTIAMGNNQSIVTNGTCIEYKFELLDEYDGPASFSMARHFRLTNSSGSFAPFHVYASGSECESNISPIAATGQLSIEMSGATNVKSFYIRSNLLSLPANISFQIDTSAGGANPMNLPVLSSSKNLTFGKPDLTLAPMSYSPIANSCTSATLNFSDPLYALPVKFSSQNSITVSSPALAKLYPLSDYSSQCMANNPGTLTNSNAIQPWSISSTIYFRGTGTGAGIINVSSPLFNVPMPTIAITFL